MKAHFALLLALVTSTPGNAGSLALTLMPPNGAIGAGETAHVDLVAMNPGSTSMPYEMPASVPGLVTVGADSWPVVLQAEGFAPTFVNAGAFTVRHYRVELPADAFGRAVLEVTPEGAPPLRAVLDVRTPADGAGPRSHTPLDGQAPTSAIDAVINRTFAGRITPNDAIYFIYGGGEDASAKFQFSFNYRLATFNWGDADAHQNSTLQLGYTQRSLWDIDGDSSPFYDSSYMPELSLSTVARLSGTRSRNFTWIGWRGGYLHESNGRAGDESRALDLLYVRPMFAVGPLESWHLVVHPELFTYFRGVAENGRIKDYRGYGKLRMVLGKNHGPSLLLAAWAGRNLDHLTYQLDLAYPIRTRFLDIESFLLLQYFRGYGESLRAYDRKSDALRFGIELVR